MELGIIEPGTHQHARFSLILGCGGTSYLRKTRRLASTQYGSSQTAVWSTSGRERKKPIGTRGYCCRCLCWNEKGWKGAYGVQGRSLRERSAQKGDKGGIANAKSYSFWSKILYAKFVCVNEYGHRLTFGGIGRALPFLPPCLSGDWVVIDVVTGKRPVHNFGHVIIQKGDKGGMAKTYTFLEQNVVFFGLHKLTHGLTFGIIYFC